jgi:hypothetical protein
MYEQWSYIDCRALPLLFANQKHGNNAVTSILKFHRKKLYSLSSLNICHKKYWVCEKHCHNHQHHERNEGLDDKVCSFKGQVILDLYVFL